MTAIENKQKPFNKVIAILRKIRDWHYRMLIPFDYIGEETSKNIYKLLTSDKPVMICRFGRIEISAMQEARNIIEKKTEYNKKLFEPLQSNAGFFPITKKNIIKFYHRMINDTKQIDLLGSWCPEEVSFKKELKGITKTKLSDLEPFFHKKPWTTALEGKKILVIHPFTKTISKQYKIRKKLFKNHTILPKFSLKTLQAIQTIGGESDRFENWFEALEYMEKKISSIEFDIAIIGCGAYGLPLAAYVKRLGKKAVHLGGSTQLLFGIKGKRWEENKFPLINKYWIKPDKEKKPKNYKKVENGCYW